MASSAASIVTTVDLPSQRCPAACICSHPRLPNALPVHDDSTTTATGSQEFVLQGFSGRPGTEYPRRSHANAIQHQSTQRPRSAPRRVAVRRFTSLVRARVRSSDVSGRTAPLGFSAGSSVVSVGRQCGRRSHPTASGPACWISAQARGFIPEVGAEVVGLFAVGHDEQNSDRRSGGCNGVPRG